MLMLLGCSIIVTMLWVMLKVGRWTAPLSGSAGLVIFFAAFFCHRFTMSVFGFFVFVCSALLFVAAGGMGGR